VESLRATTAWSDFANVTSFLLIVALALASAVLMNRNLKQVEAARSNLAALNQGLEDVVQERTREIVRANDEIQQFAYIVSHDLRAPLVNIMGFTSELEAIGESMKRQLEAMVAEAPDKVSQETREALDTELPEAISFIRASTAKMDRLIKAILDLSREGRRVLSPVQVNMTELATSIAASLKHQADEKDAEIEVGELPELVTDRLAVEQVLSNVVENAVKYLETGRHGQISITGRRDGPFIEYHVKDNGRGIDKSDRERVFELFRRAGRQDTKGEGIGLAFVRAIIRRLGGSVNLDSEPGVGTTVILRLPRVLSQPRSMS
jgi:signal transduction histidine kinase